MVAGIVEEHEAQETVVSKYAALEAPEPEETEGAAEGAEGEEGKETKEGVAAEVAEGEEAIKEAEKQLEQAKAEGDLDEIGELRVLIREMRQENLRLKVRLEKVEGVQNTEMGKEPEPGVLETLQSQINSIATQRSESFTTLLEAMEVSPKYEDVREVCSKENFNDIFEAVAKQRADDNGTSLDEEILKAKIEVWKMPNPYKYMYEVIKQYHPAYKNKPAKEAEKPAAEKPAPKTAKEILAAAEKREKKPVEAPGTVAALKGGAGEGEWTAAKIDAMSESELRKVPRDVYNKWLSGELD